MDTLSSQYLITQHLKQKYNTRKNIYDLFKKYQTLLVIKKITNIGTKTKNLLYPIIDTQNTFPEIFTQVNQDYTCHIGNISLHYKKETLGNILESTEKNLSMLNLLLVNKELYHLELIDFLIPLTFQGKILYQIVQYLVKYFPKDMYAHKLQATYFQTSVPKCVDLNLKEYYNFISRTMNIYQLLMEYLNLKTEDLFKDQSIKNLKTKNMEIKHNIESQYRPFYSKLEHLKLDYLFITISNSSDTFTLDKMAHFLNIDISLIELINTEFIKNKYTYQVILTASTLQSIDLFKIDKKLKNQFELPDYLEEITTEIIYNYPVEANKLQNNKIQTYAKIQEKLSGREMQIFQTLMKYYKTTIVDTPTIAKVENIIDNL